jgi:HlyD family secretion protein
MFPKIFKQILSHKLLTGIILVLIIGGGYFGYQRLAKNKNAVQYATATVEKGTLIVSVSGSGQVSASDQVDIKPKVSGEIAAIYIDKDQEVKANQLLVELDSRDAERAVRDAEIALNDAKGDLDKAKEDYEKIKKDSANSLSSDYEDSLDILAGTLKDLTPMISDLETMFKESSYGSKESDIDYYISLVRSIYNYRGEPNQLSYWTESAEDKFLNLKSQFDGIRTEYWKLHQNSPYDQIKTVLNQTYDLSRLLLDLTRQTSNLIEKYKKILDEESLTPPISTTITNNQASQLTKFDSTLSTYTSSLQKIKDTIDGLEENTPKQIRDAESAIQTAQNNVVKKEDAPSDAKENLAEHFIRAPFDGVVAKVNVKKGDAVSSGTTLATLITKQKIAEITLNEVDVAKVKIGQKATLTFDALPEVSISGQVSEVDTVGTVSQGVVSYGVKIAFDTQDERIKPGMSVTADIITEAKQDVLVVPNGAVKSQGNSYYVELVEVDNNEFRQQLLANVSGTILPKPPQIQAVEIGLSNDLSTEIISGLKEGDIVVTSTISSNKVQTTQTQTDQSRGTQEFRIPGMSR